MAIVTRESSGGSVREKVKVLRDFSARYPYEREHPVQTPDRFRLVESRQKIGVDDGSYLIYSDYPTVGAAMDTVRDDLRWSGQDWYGEVVLSATIHGPLR